MDGAVSFTRVLGGATPGLDPLQTFGVSAPFLDQNSIDLGARHQSRNGLRPRQLGITEKASLLKDPTQVVRSFAID
jgi:hypothetical protein